MDIWQNVLVKSLAAGLATLVWIGFLYSIWSLKELFYKKTKIGMRIENYFKKGEKDLAEYIRENPESTKFQRWFFGID